MQQHRRIRSLPLQILMDVVMAVVAGQSHQDACSTAALLLTTQTAVTHPTAERTRPSLQRKVQIKWYRIEVHVV